ncbi:hypothetical protein [uncultured Thomasclavelia sp.]|uniref:hypothetical protein n=1 Tax=uncultured Thomasclavelia sp. TaxID=3025759 RepID=UPI0025972031|nr:hypothetical protein [uncultured Thomasclavelia sp.]
MTWEEIRSETLKLLEEYSENYDELTDDEDIANKIIPATNKILFELARFKKITAYEQREVSENEILDLKTLDSFYQLKLIRGVDFDKVENFATFKENGTATIYYYKYPTLITEDTDDDFELELDLDALNIAPTGIAGTILMTDISNQYGSVFLNRYEQMLSRLDNRNDVGSITFEGGIDV